MMASGEETGYRLSKWCTCASDMGLPGQSQMLWGDIWEGANRSQLFAKLLFSWPWKNTVTQKLIQVDGYR